MGRGGMDHNGDAARIHLAGASKDAGKDEGPTVEGGRGGCGHIYTVGRANI